MKGTEMWSHFPFYRKLSAPFFQVKAFSATEELDGGKYKYSIFIPSSA